MITRAHIRRQLRASGGITNAVPRQGYFLGKIVKGIGKGLGKVVDVAKQVVKSPIGRAALIGLGGAGLMGMGPLSGLGGLGARIGGGLGALKTGLLGAASVPGVPDFVTGKGTMGLLGKLGLTKGGGSMGLTGLGKMLGAGGLIGYFVSKGASEEEAKELAQDVRRGKGIGFNQIRADLNKYRSGELSQQQMFDKNYRFLTPRNFIAAEGGRAGFADGTNYYKDVLRKKGYKDSYFKGMNDKDIRKLYDSVMGTFSLRRAEGGRVGLRSGGMNKRRDSFMAAFDAAIDRYMSINDVDVVPMDIQEGIFNSLRKKMLGRAEGGRIGLQDGSLAMNKENVKQKFVSDEAGAIPKKGGGVLPSDIGKLRRSDFDTDEDYQRYLRQLNRKAMGGIMNMPMGNMRRNRAGVMERDYRDEGGFVPVGVKEKADDVPAMLSKNEFVMTADAVRGAGDGNIKKGAQRMYDLMKRNESKVV